jgi:tripartite-type tricarboxylate transporter receptor subunit TctC
MVVIFLSGAVAAATALAAEDYPGHALRLVVPYPPGGLVDTMARIIAPPLAQRLRQPVVVENRPGAGGTIGLRVVADSPADGHTLVLMVTSTLALSPLLYPDSSPNPSRDLQPVAEFVQRPYVLVVNPSTGIRSMEDLLREARRRPGELSYGSQGLGTSGHLAVESLASMTGLQFLHVPYKGGAPAISDLISGQISLLIDAFPTTLPHIRSGRLRAVATTTANRVHELPDVATIAETVPGYEFSARVGMLVAAGTPEASIARLAADLAEVVGQPEIRERFALAGAQPRMSSAAEFRRDLDREATRWRSLMRPEAAGKKP